MELIIAIFYFLIALTSFSVVLLRPDRWAGGNDASSAVKNVILSFLHRNVANHKDIARFRYLNLICMATSALGVSILLASTFWITPSVYVGFTLNFGYIWFFITVLSHLIVSAVTPKH